MTTMSEIDWAVREVDSGDILSSGKLTVLIDLVDFTVLFRDLSNLSFLIVLFFCVELQLLRYSENCSLSEYHFQRV